MSVRLRVRTTPTLIGQGDRSIPQRAPGASGQAYCLGAVPVTLADFGCFWHNAKLRC